MNYTGELLGIAERLVILSLRQYLEVEFLLQTFVNCYDLGYLKNLQLFFNVGRDG